MKYGPSIRNVLAAGVIASVFAFSFSIGGVSAFAAGTDTQTTTGTQTGSTDTQTTVQDTTGTTTDSTAVQGTTESQPTTADTGSTETTSSDSPSLLPGDFFYFVKTITEKIQLALTFNDTDKAKKLAGFAQERLSEAQALMDQGKTDLAKTTIDEAIKQQQEAEDTADSATQDTANSATQDTAGNTQSSAPATTEDTQNGDGTQTTAKDDGGSDLKSELQSQFGQNILALQAALDKVENPRAREALSKNLAKAQEHINKMLAKKIGKLGHTDENQTVSSDEENQQDESKTATTETEAKSDDNQAVSSETEDKTDENQAVSTEKEAQTHEHKAVSTETETKDDSQAVVKQNQMEVKQQEVKTKTTRTVKTEVRQPDEQRAVKPQQAATKKAEQKEQDSHKVNDAAANQWTSKKDEHANVRANKTEQEKEDHGNGQGKHE